MQTVLVILGIWLLINVLFVVIMIPPRKPRKPNQARSSSGLAPVPIGQNAYAIDEDEKVSLRHTIIAIAMGALLSLAPPLLEAVDEIRRMIGKYRKSRPGAEAIGESDGQSRAADLRQLRAREAETSSDGSLSGQQDEAKQ